MSDVTQLLHAAGQGDTRAAAELLPLVYAELRGLATHKMASEAAGQTLQPTALVHEAGLKVASSNVLLDGVESQHPAPGHRPLQRRHLDMESQRGRTIPGKTGFESMNTTEDVCLARL